jgi:hypothetical protein
LFFHRGIKLGANRYNLREIAGSVTGNVIGNLIEIISNELAYKLENNQ